MTAPWTRPPNLDKPGHFIKGGEMEAMLDVFDAMFADWTSYTPAWIASVGTPAIGSGALTGIYRLTGKTLEFEIDLLCAADTTYGTAGAFWTFFIPSGMSTARQFTGAGHALDSGAGEYQFTWRMRAGEAGLEMFRESARFLNNTFATGIPTVGDRFTMNGVISIA